MHECNNGSPLLAAALVFSPLASQYVPNTCQECGAEGQMDDLIGRLVANVGVDRSVAATAVGIILQFLMKEGPADKVRALIDKLPGADAALK